jgi:hypothetical protein
MRKYCNCGDEIITTSEGELFCESCDQKYCVDCGDKLDDGDFLYCIHCLSEDNWDV